MFRKLLLAVATLIATMGFAFAQVDVNKADQAALDSVKGIGPKTSKAILDERKKGGDFKDWADFEKRVKGVGGKSSDKLSAAGLTVNGQPKSAASSKSATAKDDKKSTADAGKKADAGKDTKTSASTGASQEAKPAASGGSDAKAVDAKGAKKDTKKEEPKK
ncbi:MAG: competence protein ComEA [Burkholderiales bacterium]|jgi:competence protein ComEA